MALVAHESNALVEGNSRGSCPNTVLAPKASAQIDSISIDLVDTSNMDKLGDCKHFSIRGYVSEVRKKDWKKCWPFGLDNDATMSDENNKLPPLDVPNFRWWRCQNCLNDSGEGFLIADGSFSANSDKSKSVFCNHLSSHNLLLKQLPAFQQASSLKMIEFGKVDASSFVDRNRNARYHSLCDDTRAKKSEKANIPVTVGSQGQRKKRTPVLNYAAAVVSTSTEQQTDKNSHTEVAFRKKCNSFLEIPNHDLRDFDVVKADGTHEHPNVTLQNAAETLEKSNHGELTDLLCRAHKESRTASRVSVGLKDSRSNRTPLELEEHDDISETAEILHGTPPGGLHRRRTRKVRLLTELLGKSGDDKSPLTKRRDSSSRALSEHSVGQTSALADPGVLVGVQKDVTSSLVQHSGKRKLTLEEEWSSLDTSFACKKARTLNFKADGKDSDARINTSSEEPFARVDSQTGTENRLISFKIDNGPTTGKKKKKNTQGVTRNMPLTAAQENVQPEASTKAGDALKNNLFKVGDAAIAGRAMVPFHPPVQKLEKKSVSSKKKGKILQHDRLTYPDILNNSIAKEGSMSRRDKEIKQINSTGVPCMPSQDISAEKSSLLSFNNCLPALRYDRKLGPPMRDEALLLSWHEKVHRNDQHMINDFQKNYVGHPRFSSTSERGVHILGGVHADPNYRRPNYSMPWPKEKQLPPSLTEVGSHSMVHQIDDCGPSNNSRLVEIPEYPAVARRYSRQGVDLIAEQGASDDIPMEIVELMAKHQFERCLPDAETDKQFTEVKNNNRSGHRLDLNRAYGNEELLSPLQEEIFHNTKPPKYARTGSATGIDDMASSRPLPGHCIPRLDRNLYDMRQAEHIFGPKAFRPFPQFGERQQNGFQYSGKSSSRHASPYNSQWIRKTVDHKSQCSHTNMLSQRSSNKGQPAPQSKEGTQFWSAMMPNNIPMPFLFNAMPQRSVEQSISEDAPSHSHSFNIKGNTDEADHCLSFNPSKPEKHERKADSNALRRRHADFPVACKHSNSDLFDLSPNEVVPAMHLLSLMDPRIQSDAPVNMDGNHMFLKKPPFLHDRVSKELSPLPCSGYEAINGIKPLAHDNYGNGKKQMFDNISMVGASTSSQKNRSFKAANVRGEASLKHQVKGKKHWDSGNQNIGCGKRKTAPSNFGSETTCGSIPVHTMPKMVIATKEAMPFPMQFHAMGNANRHSLTGIAMSTVFPPPNSSASEICSINRNPSDFTEPGAGNPYMIRGEELIPICAFYSDNPPYTSKFVSFKQQKKLSVAKEH